MTKTNFLIASVLLTATATTAAFADDREATDPWGSVEQAKSCTGKDLGWSPSSITNSIKKKYISDACIAEVQARVDACTKDDKQKGVFEKKKADYPAGFEDYCAQTAFLRIVRQVKITDAVDVPKAAKKDAGLEKQIGAAYAKAYPANKVLKVILVADDWSTERNDYGTIIGRNIQAVVVNQQEGNYCELHSEAWYQEYRGGAYRGALTQRGAGSQQLTGILCSKATAK